MLSLSIAPQCPWHDMFIHYGAPNVHWCEELVCSYINNPANTWSNLGYVFIAIYILLKNRKLKEPVIWRRSFESFFAWSLLFTGLLSGFYHATNNYLTQFFDFIGMFTLCGSLICANYSRLSARKFSLPLFWGIVIIFSSGFFYIHYIFPVQFLIVICIVTILIQEFLIFKKRACESYTFFWLALLLMGLAQVSSQLDLQRVFCDPSNHFVQGHALWHILSAFGLSGYYLHIKGNRN